MVLRWQWNSSRISKKFVLFVRNSERRNWIHAKLYFLTSWLRCWRNLYNRWHSWKSMSKFNFIKCCKNTLYRTVVRGGWWDWAIFTTALFYIIDFHCPTYIILWKIIHCPKGPYESWKISNYFGESRAWFRRLRSKLYIPSTINIDLILWHTQLIVCAVK